MSEVGTVVFFHASFKCQHRPDRIVLASIAVLAMTITMGCASTTQPQRDVSSSVAIRTTQSSPDASRTSNTLVFNLMSFTDTYAAHMGFAASQILINSDDLQQRRAIHGLTTRFVTAAMMIASDPDPAAALLDMLFMVSLQDIVVREYWVPNIFPEHGQTLQNELNKATEYIWRLADPYLADDQEEIIHGMIKEWREQHPEQVYVSFIRFLDIPRESKLASEESGRGIMASVRSVSKTADQALMFGERALFLAKRTPFLARWQAETLLYELLDSPELSGLIAATHDMNASISNIVNISKSLPGQIAAERKNAINQLMAEFSVERAAAIEQAIGLVAAQRELMLADAIAGIDAQREATLTKLDEMVRTTREEGDRLLAHGAWLVAGLIFLLLAGQLVVLLVYRRITLNWAARENRT